MSKTYRDVFEADLGASWQHGGETAPGKRSMTQGLAPRPILFRVESAEAARELGAAFGPRDRNGVADGAEAAVDRAAGGSGAPLRGDVRERFESSLGADLSGVRVHTGGASEQAAEAVGAKAYTVGNDIHFGAGQYQPDDPFGIHLLAHEVAHTVQQAGGAPHRQHKLEVSTPGDAAEVEADAAADAMVAGRTATIGAASGGGLARKIEEKEDGKAKEEDKERMARAEQRLKDISSVAGAYGTSVLGDGDISVGAVQKALDHLTTGLENYNAAYAVVKAKLETAEKHYQMEQAVLGAVKDTVFGSTLGLIAPEAMFLKAMTVVRNKQGEIVETLSEVASQVGGMVLSTAGGAAAKGTSGAPAAEAPKDSLAAAGLTPGDKAFEAFNHLSSLIKALPALGLLGSAIKDIAIAAARVSSEAVKLGAGQPAELSMNKVDEFADLLEALSRQCKEHVGTSSKARQKMEALAAGVTNVKQLSASEIEDKLWTQWIASRETRAQRDMLDLNPLEQYLGSRGLLKDMGDYTSDQDEDKAVTDAQKRFLADQQVEAPDDPQKVASLYKREMKCNELKRTYTGKIGQIVAEGRINVDGVEFSCPANAGAQVGDSVKVSFFVAKAHRQGPDVILVDWTNNDFDCLGNKAEAKK